MMNYLTDEQYGIRDQLSEAAAEIVDTLPVLHNLLRDAYREAETSEDKVKSRILRDRIGVTFKSVIQLIEKIEFRPILLDRARRVLDVADRPEYIKDVIGELGKARIQDREFDHDLDALYREARTRLSVLESGDLELAEQQEAL